MLPPVSRVPGKTGRLYASLPFSYYTGGEITDSFVALLTEGSLSGDGLTGSIFNVLADVALENFDGLAQYREQFLKAGAEQVYLAGSGPALFTLIENKAQAEKIYENLQQQGFESYLTDTLDAIDK